MNRRKRSSAAASGNLLKIACTGVVILGLVILAGCAPRPTGETGTEIVEASAVAALLEQPGAILVDARSAPDYRQGHIPGAVNVSRADIVVMTPFPALLAPPEQIERALGSRGISNDSLVVVYDDNNNMDAARLWWTLKVYGHHQVKVVSGGLEALKREGYSLTTEAPAITPAVFTAQQADKTMMISAAEVRAHLNEPDPSVVLIDTRSDEEFLEGHIPGALHIDYRQNNFRDGTFKPVNHIRIDYLKQGIDYTKDVILYCHTSIRGTPTFLALYNAGYRSLRLYDGAWVEWTANPMNPVYRPDPETLRLRAPDQS
ncbi:thiosulfate/3-mercaptopyruvate sulfurtransferase [Alkalispirochaeta americana]|uniref:Thiosulfate/3-mercaptopyruvate sulfurtransferase n=1 Tax=Alkalispirochaeta americana TaxID=159291 RepID=A0A1N6RWY5_9SPIO|nr:sulfurtransferase [Alkalispirochaeta americana]SIQ33321.1 thiosulfate/3-mercaptopyruvate sulfurtransferase [Alkalispirochaeta americana]